MDYFLGNILGVTKVEFFHYNTAYKSDISGPIFGNDNMVGRFSSELNHFFNVNHQGCAPLTRRILKQFFNEEG